MVLTERQRQDLHKAVAEYLVAQGESFAEAAAAFCKCADLGEAESHKPTSSIATPMLEKKWTSIVRLQKKVMELETKNKVLLEENEMCATPKKRGAAQTAAVATASSR